MNFIALRMLTGDRAKYLGLIFAVAFCTFLLENQTSIFAGILNRTGSQILDVTDADVWVMDAKTEYFEQTKALKDTDLTRVRGVDGVEWAVNLFKATPVARTRAGKFASCILLGLDDATLAGAPRKMVLGSWERLREPDSVVIDKAGYILLFPDEPLELGRELEMNDRHRDIRTEGLNATHKSGVGRKTMNLYGPKQLVESARTRPDEQQTNQGPRSEEDSGLEQFWRNVLQRLKERAESGTLKPGSPARS